MSNKPSRNHEELVGKLLKSHRPNMGMWEDTYHTRDGCIYGSCWSGVVLLGDIVVCAGFVGAVPPDNFPDKLMMKILTKEGDARFVHFVYSDWELL